MASPTLYSLAYDFTAFQASFPSTPLPADKIEIEFNAIETTTNEIITNLNLIQRSDGELANGIVTFDSLSNTVKALLGSSIVPEGDWVTATAYTVLDLVVEDGSTYICAEDHTSGTFATDLAAGKWILWAAGSGGSITINNSNWSGEDLSVVNGGTGVSTLTGIVKGNGTSAFSAASAGTDYYAPGSTDIVVADGGTGRSSHTAYAVICGGTSTTGAQQSVASVGTAGQVLMSNGAGALPTFQTFSTMGADLQTNGNMVHFSKGSDIASASGLTLTTDGNYFDVTGTTTITSIGTSGYVGTHIKLHFDGVLTLTHHATDLILPGGANITTAAGDEAEFVEYATGDWRCTSYVRANGKAVRSAYDYVSSSQTITSSSEVTVSHGFSSTPVEFGGYMVCNTTDSPYAVGDTIMVGQHQDNANFGILVRATSTQLKAQIGSSGIAGFGGSYAATGLTEASWDLYLWARDPDK